MRWLDFFNGVLANFMQYKLPVIRLMRETPKDAVCTIFEKVNTGGVALNVFELLTAMYAPHDFRLKDDWASRREKFDKRPVLKSLESVDFLQIVSLLATYDHRSRFLSNPTVQGQPPGVSCKRKDILKMSLYDYRTWAGKATDALDWAAQFMSQQHIFRAADLPYRTQLVPLAAIRAVLGGDAAKYGNAAKLDEWYWCGVLGELYGGATETRFARDLEQVVEWAHGGPPPGSVVEASFRAPRLLTLRTRNSAAYKGIYALLMRQGGLDWVRKEKMDQATFMDYQVDIHHIFPKDWCDNNHVDGDRRESIVNKTALSASTNRSIGGRSPKQYMPALARSAEVSDERIDEIVSTHGIAPASIRAADFNRFFADRTEALLKLISEAMGKEATRDDTEREGDTSAFIDEPLDAPTQEVFEVAVAS